MSALGRSSAAALGLLTLLWSADAAAFCRTRTCDPRDPAANCEIDPITNCVTTGDFLHWPTQCVSFSVQEGGSPLRGINFQEARDIVSGAFQKWISVSCNGGFPSIDVADRGAVSCDYSEYNQTTGNANSWLFRDNFWPHEGPNATLALTIITFNTKNGEIFDADVEVNSFENQITISNEEIGSDLESIVTHEAGHFLGLSHTNVPGATMVPDYHAGQTHLRSLEEDDAAGMCATYPVGRQAEDNNCVPRHGYSALCGTEQEATCSAAPQGNRGNAAFLGALAAAATIGLRRKRRA